MTNQFSRREFLKLGALGLAGLAFKGDFPPGREEVPSGILGRVTYDSISVFDKPILDASTVGFRFRDELMHIYERVTSTNGPVYNPLWYRVWGGYVHSAHVQEILLRFNPVFSRVASQGQLTELTVPFSQPYKYTSAEGWSPQTDFRLYYESTHWVTDVVEGPDRQPWYQITDELWDGFNYFVPAAHLRMIPDEELSTISPDVPAGDKWISVNIKRQSLSAYEGEAMVFRTEISTGIPSTVTINGYATSTPIGTHHIQSKMPSKHMGGSRLTDTLGDRALPGVPWTMFFAVGGYALHGTYWHNNFGWPMSRGCINMRNQDAKWLFRWITPLWYVQDVESSADWESRGYGTRLEVVES